MDTLTTAMSAPESNAFGGLLYPVKGSGSNNFAMLRFGGTAFFNTSPLNVTTDIYSDHYTWALRFTDFDSRFSYNVVSV
jgi:hypothetical protein